MFQRNKLTILVDFLAVSEDLDDKFINSSTFPFKNRLILMKKDKIKAHFLRKRLIRVHF